MMTAEDEVLSFVCVAVFKVTFRTCQPLSLHDRLKAMGQSGALSCAGSLNQAAAKNKLLRRSNCSSTFYTLVHIVCVNSSLQATKWPHYI